MEGTLRSFLPSKGYGFIRGDDSRDYFAHQSQFVGAQAPIEGLRVSFDEAASPKGYRAMAIRTLEVVEADRWSIPNEILHSRGPTFQDWETLESSLWTVHSSSRESPDVARLEALLHAKALGASGLALMKYYTTSGSEPANGGGRGTHHYTIHHFCAHPVVLARRSAEGQYRAAELKGLDARVTAAKTAAVMRTDASTRKAWLSFGMLGVAPPCAIALWALIKGIPISLTAGMFGCGLVLIMGMATLAARNNHDAWLQPPLA